MVGGLIGTLMATGLILATQVCGGTAWRQLGLAVESGGIVGGVLTIVNAMTVTANEEWSPH